MNFMRLAEREGPLWLENKNPISARTTVEQTPFNTMVVSFSDPFSDGMILLDDAIDMNESPTRAELGKEAGVGVSGADFSYKITMPTSPTSSATEDLEQMIESEPEFQWKRGSTESALTSLTDALFLNIAPFATGKDMYTLSLSSVRFFHGDPRVQPVLATRLLRVALKSGLSQVLSCQGICLEQLKPCSDVGARQAIISGSAIVQATIGLTQCSDVDVFCCWSAAPKVQAKLTTAGEPSKDGKNDLDNKLVLGGISDGGEYNWTGKRLLERQLHHVENYCMVSRLFGKPEEQKQSHQTSVEGAKALKKGGGALCEKVSRKTGALRMPAKDGVSWSGGDGVRLVVAKPGRKDARCLLATFDKTICQAHFDLATGKFHTPFPHLTFNEEPPKEPARLQMVQDYFRLP
jgi:hypothetical protein